MSSRGEHAAGPALPAPADVLLSDGSVAVIRAVARDDAAQLHRLHEQVSDENYRLRFFAIGRHTGHEYVEHLLRDSTLAIVMELHGRIVALATAELIETDSSEVAFLVEDGHHGQGMGSLLLEHLAAAARRRGTATFEADVLVENYAMLSVFTDAGFTYKRHTEDGIVTVRLDTRETSTSTAAADARDRRAESRSLHPLLYPSSVAVLGVRRDGSGIGRAVLDSIQRGGFTGQLYVVHPEGTRIPGVQVYSGLDEVPDPVDLAVIAVPANQVLAAVAGAADAGVPCAVVITSGFGELGEAGAVMQRDLAILARTRSIRIVGPNCLGVMSNHPDIRLNATFTDIVPPAGGLAVATQSGGVGIVLTDLARELGLGVGSLVSLGNKADVSGNDLLAAWTDDPLVSAAALYLESFGNAPKFARIARRFAEAKPLLAVVGGRSAGGHRAGASHTAAAATPAVGVDALFAQAGVIACEDAEDLAQAALLLTREPMPRGPRIGIISNAGGMGVLAADAATTHGLRVPELSLPTQKEIAGFITGTVGTSNPVDAGAAVAAEDFAQIVEQVLVSGEVDAALVVLVGTSLTDPAPVLQALALLREKCRDTPILLVTHGVDARLTRLPAVTTFPSSGAALRALGHAAWYAAWLAERTAQTAADGDGSVDGTPLHVVLQRRVIADQLIRTEANQEGWVGAAAAAELLGEYGLAPVGAVAAKPEAVAELAQSLGFPVAIKVADRDIVHRTERGLVRVGLDTTEEVRSAVAAFARELGRPDSPVLVQPMVAGTELAVGVVRDPSFGPLVMVGAGGVDTDVLADRTYMLPPVHEADVRRALRGLRCWPLLEGFRGAPRADVDALVELVLAVGRLVRDVPEVAELDLNPVVVSANGCSLVDVKLRLQGLEGDPETPRQLRPRPRL